MSCKYKCGQTFNNVVELFRHNESCNNLGSGNNLDLDIDGRSNQSFEESFMSDNSHNNNSSSGGGNNNNSCDPNNSSDERKVRVRTLISDEQLSVLKTHYLHNPRPKREELEKIADQIGHPFKVVKVWFQNSRARDRREGKPANSPSHHDLSGVPNAAAAALAAHLPFFMNNGGSNLPTGQQGFPFLNNNFPPVNAAALMAAGLLPRMGGIMSELFGANTSNERSSPSPHSDSKSMCSLSASEDENDHPVSPPKVNTADQPLDLSNKGPSPSVSPHHHISSLFSSPNPFSISHQLNRFGDDNEGGGTSSSNEEDGNYVCDKEKCEKTFTKRSSLARHKYEHSGKIIYSFIHHSFINSLLFVNSSFMNSFYFHEFILLS